MSDYFYIASLIVLANAPGVLVTIMILSKIKM